jgi:hypothetical protein
MEHAATGRNRSEAGGNGGGKVSLDVYLESDEPFTPPAHRSGIFIRHEGRTVEITRDQWDLMNPSREPVMAVVEEETTTLFHANITHNLNLMAEEVGIYMHLWRPEEIGITHAAQLVKPLSEGLGRLIAAPERYRRFNPTNGWGSYEGMLDFVSRYLAACEQWRTARIEVSR